MLKQAVKFQNYMSVLHGDKFDRSDLNDEIMQFDYDPSMEILDKEYGDKEWIWAVLWKDDSVNVFMKNKNTKDKVEVISKSSIYLLNLTNKILEEQGDNPEKDVGFEIV